jgi:hypothetical protein
MSKIKELKTNSDNNLNFIEVLELFSPNKKSKYTDMLLRMMNRTKNFDSHIKETKEEIVRMFDFIKAEDLEKFSPLQTLMIYKFIDSFFNQEDLTNFRKFAEYNERGLISQNDLTKYNSLEEVIQQLSLAELKVESKGLENEISKVYEDDEWLLVRPLTYLSSRKYGANTKWCTTQTDNPEYFLKYSKKGVLIYCINKVTGYKVASFYSLDKNDPEFSFWNQKDTRIDSLDSELTDELRKIVQETSKDKKAKTNRFLLSDEQREREEKLLNTKGYRSGSFLSEPEPIQEREERLLSNRIEAAIRRENEETDVSEEIMESQEPTVVNGNTIMDRMMWSSTTSTTTTTNE